MWQEENTIKEQVREVTWLTEENIIIIQTQERTAHGNHSFCKCILIRNTILPGLEKANSQSNFNSLLKLF